MPRCSPMPVVIMYIFVSTFFQGTDAICIDVDFLFVHFFRVPMPRCSPEDYKNSMGRGQQTDRRTL